MKKSKRILALTLSMLMLFSSIPAYADDEVSSDTIQVKSEVTDIIEEAEATIEAEIPAETEAIAETEIPVETEAIAETEIPVEIEAITETEIVAADEALTESVIDTDDIQLMKSDILYTRSQSNTRLRDYIVDHAQTGAGTSKYAILGIEDTETGAEFMVNGSYKHSQNEDYIDLIVICTPVSTNPAPETTISHLHSM